MITFSKAVKCLQTISSVAEITSNLLKSQHLHEMPGLSANMLVFHAILISV